MKYQYMELLQILSEKVIQLDSGIRIANAKKYSRFIKNTSVLFTAEITDMGLTVYDPKFARVIDKHKIIEIITNSNNQTTYTATITSQNEVDYIIDLVQQLLQK